MKAIKLCFISILAAFGNQLNYDVFIQKVFDRSQNLIMQDAMTRSLDYEGRAMGAWDSPYLEINPSAVRNPNSKKWEPDAQILFMLTPKMPWVSGVIKDSYAIKMQKSSKILELQKNIVEINAKRAYLEYTIYNEQRHIYEDKYLNAQRMYDFSAKKFEQNRISKAELLRFKSDLSNAKNALDSADSLLNNALTNLRILVDDNSFNYIPDFEFSTHGTLDLSPYLQHIIYNEILELEASDYEKSAKVLERSVMNSMSFGAGYSFGAKSIDFRLILPLPITPQASNQKQALLELQSARLKGNAINKNLIEKNAMNLMERALEQEKIIAQAQENEKNNLELFEIIMKGFEEGAINAFEYLNVQNNYLNARIQTTNEKLKYIANFSLLEETLGTPIKLGE